MKSVSLRFELWSLCHISTSTALLFTTGVAKLITLASRGDSKILAMKDSIFLVPIGWLLGATALIELGIALLLAFSVRSPIRKSDIAGMFGFLLLLYRSGSAWIGDEPCSCLGALIDWLPWLERNRNEVAWCVIVYLIVGCFISRFLAPKSIDANFG